MPQLKQRVFQIGAAILAISMLGGYVVYSQKSHQPGQIMPGSKVKALPAGVVDVNGLVLPSDTSAGGVVVIDLTTHSPQLMMSSSKGGVFTVSSQQSLTVPQAGSAEIMVLSGTNRSRTFMSGSKFATVVRPEELQRIQTNIPASNPPPRMMMPGSKSYIGSQSYMFSPSAGSGSVPSLATNDAAPAR